MRTITLITTGGTIEKTFDERTGTLENRRSLVRDMLATLRLEDAKVEIVELMSIDSLEMDDDDRGRIVEAVLAAGAGKDGEGAGAQGCKGDVSAGVVILHGTDTLEKTGEALVAALGQPRAPVVLTGAMRPYEMARSDAVQNLTEAVFATGVLTPGVYCVAHGRALRFPGVVKDRDRGTFIGGVGEASRS